MAGLPPTAAGYRWATPTMARRMATVQPLTLGVEEEYLVVDAATGELASRSHELLPRAEEALGDEVSPELFLCQVEVCTPVCDDLDQVGANLHRLRGELSAVGRPLGLAIAPAGTHPSTPWDRHPIDRTNERYAELGDRFQLAARQQIISGCHVHVGIDDPDRTIAAMNRVRPWLPVLLALSANSPYWQGEDTGYASYRLELWRTWPTTGIPPLLEDRRDYEQLIHTLESIDAIEDPTYLYWQVRPSERFPTLEFRVLDVCIDVDHAVALAGLVRALAWTALREVPALGRSGLPHTEVIDSAMWRAARYGLDGLLVSPATLTVRPAAAVVDELLAHVAEGLEVHGDRERVVELVGEIVEHGNGAQRQRRAFQRTGCWRDVIAEIVGRPLASLR
jgi:glutamate---cysteine ligase / carboxylate-amine ligase